MVSDYDDNDEDDEEEEDDHRRHHNHDHNSGGDGGGRSQLDVRGSSSGRRQQPEVVGRSSEFDQLEFERRPLFNPPTVARLVARFARRRPFVDDVGEFGVASSQRRRRRSAHR